MEIKVNSNELTKRLEQLVKVIASRSVLQILNDVMVSVHGDTAVLTASDSEQYLSLKCKVKDNVESFKFCVNARDFLELVKNIIDTEITISLDENDKVVFCDYGNGNFSMPYENADEFPTQNICGDNETSVVLDSKKVLKSLELTKFAVGNSIVRPIINGINFNFCEGSMVVSATDTFTVALYEDDTVECEDSTSMNFTIPKKSADVLSSILRTIEGDIKISSDNSSISVSNSDFKMTARIICGNFPNVKSVIPDSTSVNVTIDRMSMISAMKRVLPVSDDMSNLVVMFFEKGQVTLSADNAQFGKSASETIVCDCDNELKIGFKGSSFVEILRNIDDENVSIGMTTNVGCAIFNAVTAYKKKEYTLLLSPSLIK